MKESKVKIAVAGKVPGKEVLGHALGGVGQNLIYALWSGYITIFYTDVFGLSAAFIGLLFLTARIWDAVNDPMMGVMADRTRSKHGRFRVWMLRMPIFVGACLILNFTVPTFGGTGKLVYAAITYVLMGMAFTSLDIPYWSLPAAMSSDPIQRTKIFTTSTLATNLASVAAGILVVPLIGAFGQGNLQKGYFSVAVLFAVVGCSLYFTCFRMVKEHVHVSLEKFSFKLAIKSLITNKPLLCIISANFVINLAFITKMAFGTYYTKYVLGDFNLMSLMSFLSLPGIVIGTIMAPIISKKIGKKYTLIAMTILNLVISVVFFFTGYDNLAIVFTCTCLQVVCVGASFVMVSTMTADTIEYGEWMTGQRNDAVITSTRTLITKMAAAMTGIATAVILTVSKYQPNIEQSVSTKNAFHFIASLLPGIVMIIGIIPMFFYTLTEKRHAEIIEELGKRKSDQTI